MERRFSAIAVVALGLGLAATAGAQVLNPAKLDKPGQPFTYFSRATDVLGFKDATEGTEVTPEGYLYTGFAEFMFFTGDPPVPVQQRIRTLEKGYLPIIHYRVSRDSLCYKFTMFAVPLDFQPESNLINFVRVKVTNHSSQPRFAVFWAATRYDAPKWSVRAQQGRNRFRRPAKSPRLGTYLQAGTPFREDWTFDFAENGLYRSDSLLYAFSGAPQLYLDPFNRWRPRLATAQLHYDRTSPVGMVKYAEVLAPGASYVVELRIPYWPLPKGDPLIEKIKAASFDEYRQRVAQFWDDILAQGMQVELDEPKVVNAFKANLIYDLIARDKIGDNYIQKVNEFQYDAFWLRDASFIVRSYDVTGYHKVAEQCLRFFLDWQQEDGNFVSQHGQFDGWGQTLWAFGQHVKITGDTKFAREVLPAVKKAVDWFERTTAADTFHIMPRTRPGDNESITGHVTGHNFWAMAGLRGAIQLAEAVGDQASAARFRQIQDRFRRALMERLAQITAVSGGYIPPGLDGLGGQDWGNLLSVYIGRTLEPYDPWVSRTQDVVRQKFREGIMTYLNQRALHHYVTFNVIQTSLIRGEQRQVIEDLYAILLHTSATHAGFEWTIEPWDNREPCYNLTPHGWFAARYRTLIRNLLVREWDGDLHLLSALSPVWIGPGKTLVVRNAPTDFGVVSLTLECDSTGALLTLDTNYRERPRAIWVHLPWWLNTRSVRADGKPIPFRFDAVKLDPGVHQIRFEWVQPSRIRETSYKHTVEMYKTEYRHQYERFVREGDLVQGYR